MLMRAFAFAGLLASPAQADVAEAVRDVILPGYAGFAEATAALSASAAANCADQAALSTSSPSRTPASCPTAAARQSVCAALQSP